jgi:hypothetical protein
MPESWFELSPKDQADALEVASAKLGRPAYLLEKDIWVVWALGAIYDSPFGEHLTFKGGTSLSKAYKVIDRFSEDIDLTYDIRNLLPNREPIPVTKSQAKKTADEAKARLADWIAQDFAPFLQQSLSNINASAHLEISGNDSEKLTLHYPALKTGVAYVSPTVQLEFGARATGEPNEQQLITCDMDGLLEGITFPTCTARVMKVERTFWEKATAAHVFCLQGRFRGERFARHWYDLVAISQSPYFQTAIQDKALARSVAEHKSWFFAEKDSVGNEIDYQKAANGGLVLVPTGDAYKALAEDYRLMAEAGLLSGIAQNFESLIASCGQIAEAANGAVS